MFEGFEVGEDVAEGRNSVGQRLSSDEAELSVEVSWEDLDLTRVDLVVKQQFAAVEVESGQKVGFATDVEIEVSSEGETSFAIERCFVIEAAFTVNIDWLSVVEKADLGTESAVENECAEPAEVAEDVK